VHIAALKQERALIKTPPGYRSIETGDDVAWRHRSYRMRNSKQAKLGQIDVGPTSQWACSVRHNEIYAEIIKAEVVADTHLAPIAALECQQIMDTLAQRLPRELRDSIYKWLVPTKTFRIITKSSLGSLPTLSTPHAVPSARSLDGFSFSMFYYMKGDHFLEILQHWYERQGFNFQIPGGSSSVFKFLAKTPLGTNVVIRDVMRSISITFDIPHLNEIFKRRYFVETEVSSRRMNFLQCLRRINRAALCFDRANRVHIRLDKAQDGFWDPVSRVGLEDLFESLWPYMEKLMVRGFKITMNGTIPDLKTPSPKTWASCYLNVRIP
jgi:hypothetical protein